MTVSLCSGKVASRSSSRLTVLTLCAVLAVNTASAMGVSPILVDLSPQNRVASVTLTNPSAQSKTFQAQTLSWLQDGAADQYTESSNLLVSPSIAQIGAGQTQVFRVVLRSGAPAQTENAYRLILEDITDESERTKDQALVYMLLRFNLPVFAAPLANPRAVPRWSLCTAPAGKACLRLDNDGNRRIRLSALNVEGQGWRQALPGGITVLAGAWRQWTFDQALATPGMPLRVSATSESGPLNTEINAAPR